MFGGRTNHGEESGDVAASILAAWKLAQYDSRTRLPATIMAIGDAVQWAEQIMRAIDERWPVKSVHGSPV